MKIERIQISIKELVEGYEEKGLDGIEGIVAYGGKLDVRPPYQREYVYAPKERDEVIRTVKKVFRSISCIGRKMKMEIMS